MKNAELLHSRVREAIAGSLAADPCALHWDDGVFGALALALFHHHEEHGSAYGRFLDGLGVTVSQVEHWTQIPAVPTDLWKYGWFGAFPQEEMRICFRTSGTTMGRRGVHPIRDPGTYESSLRPWFGAFFAATPGARWLSLIPRPSDAEDSSLSYMVGCVLPADAAVVADGVGIDLDAAASVLRSSASSGVPLHLLSTARALQALLDGPLRGRPVVLPRGSAILETGGWKKEGTTVPSSHFYPRLCAALGVDRGAIVSEYGMTELGAQGYHPGLRLRKDPAFAARWGAAFRAGPKDKWGESPLLVFPPWCRVRAIDPDDGSILPMGARGLLRFWDLSNVDSVLAVQSADEGIVYPTGVELFGRAPGATPRGCSLAVDERLLAQGAGGLR